MDYCIGELKGDPDIAGVGVTLATCITTALAIVVSTILWYYAVILESAKEGSTQTWQYRVWLKIAFALGDVQLATALSTTLATIILIRSKAETSLYHVFTARSLIQLNLAGHSAAVSYDIRRQYNWGLRLLILGATIWSHFWLTLLSMEEFEQWDTRTPKCFHNDSIIPGTYKMWMKLDLFWTPITYTFVFAEALPSFRGLLRSLNKGALSLPLDIKAEIGNMLTWSCIFDPITFMRRIALVLARLVCFVLAILIICPPSLAPLYSLFFSTWATYDLMTARAANKHILVTAPSGTSVSLQGHENPEDDWGFGQLLPLFLLQLIVLQVADGFAESREKKRDEDSITSMGRLDPDVLERGRLAIVQKSSSTLGDQAKQAQH